MRKKVLVISHERSGTHFLINTIAECFGYSSMQIDLDSTQGFDWRNPEVAHAWLQQFKGRFIPNIFKSHHACPLLVPALTGLHDEFEIFYIRRDGRDVMTSFWVYLNRLAHGWGPQTRTVGEFMKTIASGGITQYQATPDEISMLQRWSVHVSGWTNTDLPVHQISYESLHTRFDELLAQLSGIFGHPACSATRPTLESPSSLPWRGNIGTWKEFFTKDDIDYFEQHAGQADPAQR